MASLIGRVAELAEIIALTGRDRPVVVVGEAGIGKTSLVRAAAEATGRVLHEGGGFATLATLPYLAIRRAIGLPVAGDPSIVAAQVERAVGPDLLFVDDLQWADPASCEVVNLLVDRVAVIVAIREGDPNDTAALEPLVARGAKVVRLGGLSADDARTLAARLHPDAGPTQLGRLVERAGGNPLLLEELGTTDRAPSSLSRAIVGQVASLAPADRRALELLALAGRPLPEAALGRAAGRLQARGLAVAASDGLAIRHSLIAEAIAAQIDDAGRARLHARLATLAREPAQRARHLAAAGRRGQAFEVARAAYDEATDPRTRADLLLVLAATAGSDADTWRVEAARHLRGLGRYEDAADLLRDPISGSDELRALGTALLAGSLDHDGRNAEAVAILEEGGRLLRPDPASDGAIELAAVQAVVLVNAGRLHDAIAVAERASAAAGDAPRAYRLAGNLAALRLYAAETDQLDALVSALDASFAVGDAGTAAGRAMDLYYLTLAIRGGAAAAAVAVDAAGRLERFGYHTRATELRAESAQAMIFAGELASTVVFVDSMLEEPLGLLSRQRLLYNRGLALGLMGRVEEAERTLHDVDAVATDNFDGRGAVRWCWAEVAVWNGQPRRALELAQSSLEFLAFNDAEFVLPSLARAWAEVELGLTPTSGTVDVPFRDLAGAPPEARGLAALAADDPARAATEFGEAAGLWTGFHETRATICTWAAGEALRRAGASQAVETLRAALASAIAIGFEPLAARARRSLRLAGQRPAPAAAPARSGGLLTARESELVRLVEQGLNNVEIARRLGLGRPTVARMLTSAMGKLGVERRTQLAARELV